MTHTPGPWTAHDEEKHWAVYAGNTLVARVPVRAGSWERDKANARLIAAAPDLLAAMESFELYPCVGESCRTEYPAGLCPGCHARAAIAQAKETK